jgi:hypothetical protein
MLSCPRCIVALLHLAANSSQKAERGFHSYPIATIAFYGPTYKLATKVAVSIILTENHEPDLLERWFSDSGCDVRHDPAIGEQVVAFLKTRAVRSTVVADASSHHRLPPRGRRGLSRRKVIVFSALTGRGVIAGPRSESTERIAKREKGA